MKHRDFLILGLVLLTSLTLFLLRPAAVDDDAAVYLRITVPGQTYDLIPLTEDREIVIEQEDGCRNVVEIFPGGFRMKESNCPSQSCVLQGDVTTENIGTRALGNQIVCLPHQLVLELVTADGDPVEADP